MSAEGLLEVAFVTWGNVVALVALFITIISGYMVVAFVAGKQMTRSQVILVNILYFYISSLVGWACIEMSKRASIFEEEAYALTTGPIGELISRGDVAIGIISALGLSLFASLKFMWDIRHPKAE